MKRKVLAELLGTFWLVFGGCGAAIFAGDKIGFVGVSFAFGLTVVTMAYAIGHISGCHLNPAVSVGLANAGRFPHRELPHYVAAQVAGAALASLALMVIARDRGVYETASAGAFATNTYGAGSFSPAGTAFLAETILTFFFLFIILGATDGRAPAGFAGLAIGLGLTLIHLIGIPLTNLSVNPARSTGPALFVGGAALAQLWLFWAAPILGGGAAGFAYRALASEAPRG